MVDHLMLTREQILTADDLKSEIVEVPEWGGSVRVAAMSGAQRDAFEMSLLVNGKPDLTNSRAKLVAASVMDEAGAPMFTPADIEALGRKNAAALSRIVEVARRLSAIGEAELEVVKGN